ncbi:MAG: hypothetical protein AAGJ82_14545 [Bacteroidota bacterium]
MKSSFFFTLLLFCALTATATNPYYQAYLSNDLAAWEQAINTDARLYEQTDEA